MPTSIYTAMADFISIPSRRESNASKHTKLGSNILPTAQSQGFSSLFLFNKANNQFTRHLYLITIHNNLSSLRATIVLIAVPMDLYRTVI
jgi:hypothetical protein